VLFGGVTLIDPQVVPPSADTSNCSVALNVPDKLMVALPGLASVGKFSEIELQAFAVVQAPLSCAVRLAVCWFV
jgi:hypothetical protein